MEVYDLLISCTEYVKECVNLLKDNVDNFKVNSRK